MRIVFACLLFVLSSLAVPLAFAESADQQAASIPSFTDGFANLSSRLEGAMGEPIAHPAADLDGNVTQQTSTGLAYWLKDSNLPAFTDGFGHYALGTVGLMAWTGESVEPQWHVPTSPREYLYASFPDVARCEDSIFTNESHWMMVWNREGSGAFGVGQFMKGTFYGHAAEMQQRGVWPFFEAPDWSNAYHQVAVGAFDLRRGLRRQWTAPGC